MSFGEILSCLIIALYGTSIKVPLYFLDARDLVATDATFGNARVDFAKTNEAIQRYFSGETGIPIITGFIARSPDGSTTTLGRSGSDYTASIFGAAMDASVIEIWTDVDGVLTCDLRLVPEAFVLPKISYEEAMELSHFGAKVIHPQTVQPVVAKGIPLLIKNTLNPFAPGTLISHETTNHEMLVKGIAAIDGCTLITIKGAFMVGTTGAAMRVFKAVASRGVSVILISQGSSEYTLCLAIKNESMPNALDGLREEFQQEMQAHSIEFIVKEHQSIVAVVGDEMEGRPGVAGKLFSTLGQHRVNISAIAQGGSERNISFQCYVPPIHALLGFEPEKVIVSTYQAISGAGKTFTSWPEMVDNVIPFIGGEEKKSEDEPLKVWGKIINGTLEPAVNPKISATCIRVPVTNGHMASVNVSFRTKPTREQILNAWKNFNNQLAGLGLPSAPKEFLKYFEEENRPQTLLDRDLERGMAIGLGRLREDPLFDWKFVALSHNTIRGAAGGAVLVAELLKAKGYV